DGLGGGVSAMSGRVVRATPSATISHTRMGHSPRWLWHGLPTVPRRPTAGLPVFPRRTGDLRSGEGGTVGRPCHNEEVTPLSRKRQQRSLLIRLLLHLFPPLADAAAEARPRRRRLGRLHFLALLAASLLAAASLAVGGRGDGGGDGHVGLVRLGP